MTLTEAKKRFRAAHPNLRTNGWDERDYDLSSRLMQIPSYGLIAGREDGVMVSRSEVIDILRAAAEERFEEHWRTRLAVKAEPRVTVFEGANPPKG